MPDLLGHPVCLFLFLHKGISDSLKSALNEVEGFPGCPAWKDAAFHSLDSIGFPAQPTAGYSISTTIQISRATITGLALSLSLASDFRTSFARRVRY